MSPAKPMPDRHLMVDIESLDISTTAAVISIGAAVFNPRSEGYEDTYYVKIDEDSNRYHGRSVSQSTLDWWAQQDAVAREVFEGPHTPLQLAMAEFTQWINRLQPTCTRVWAKSPDFDCKILQHACEGLGLIWPFKFWENRCCRTLMEAAYPEGDFPAMAIEGVKHNALTDAKLQVLEIQHAYFVLGI